jgi:TonB family protein
MIVTALLLAARAAALPPESCDDYALQGLAPGMKARDVRRATAGRPTTSDPAEAGDPARVVGYRDGESTAWVEYDRAPGWRADPLVVRVWTSTDLRRVELDEFVQRLVDRFGEPTLGAEHLAGLGGPIRWIDEECGLELTLSRRERGEWWAPLSDEIVVELRPFGGDQPRQALPASAVSAPAERPDPILVEARRIASSYVRPRYPEFGPRPHVSAKVRLGLAVRADGTVGDIEVLDCSIPWEGFEFAAIEAARRWRYEPATRDGAPVDSVVEVEVRFR